jgi:hypothetical protein
VQTTSLSRGTTYCFSCSNCLWNSAGGPQQVVLNAKEAEFLGGSGSGSSSSNDKPSNSTSDTAGTIIGASVAKSSGDEKQSGSDGEGKNSAGASDVLLQGQHPLLHMAVPEDLGRNLLAVRGHYCFSTSSGT